MNISVVNSARQIVLNVTKLLCTYITMEEDVVWYSKTLQNESKLRQAKSQDC